MPLPAGFVKETSLEDLRRRFRNTLVSLGDNPFVIGDIRGVGRGIGFGGILMQGNKGTSEVVPVEDPALDCAGTGSKLGFFNLDNAGAIGFINRIPVRGTQQGVSFTNVEAFIINSAGVIRFGTRSSSLRVQSKGDAIMYKYWRGPNKINEEYVENLRAHLNCSNEFAHMLATEGFVNMFVNKYPSVKEALETKRVRAALSRRFWLHVDSKKSFLSLNVFLYNQFETEIGAIHPDAPGLVVLKPAFKYMRELVQRELKLEVAIG